MRKIVICFCILFAALSLKAQSISGIRIDGGDSPILVYFGGVQMCLPTTSCFVANLKAGTYTIEVYASRSSRPGERTWKGERLYNSRVYFNGSEIKDILVENREDDRPSRPNRPNQDDHYPDYDRSDKLMSPRLFDTFFKQIKNEPFASGQLKMIQSALVNADFTSAQCLRLISICSFDSEKVKIMKMMYPNIIDKQAFFTVVNSLDFSTNKNEMEKFMRDSDKRR